MHNTIYAPHVEEENQQKKKKQEKYGFQYFLERIKIYHSIPLTLTD